MMSHILRANFAPYRRADDRLIMIKLTQLKPAIGR